MIARNIRSTALPNPLQQMTAVDLAALSDTQLARLDPLIANLIVARGIPGLEHLDITAYAKTVDDWAARIDAANKVSEPFCKDEPTYKVSREFWMAGGMAVMLAGPRFGISYTSENLDAAHPEQQFIHGVIDTRRGTCATMPVLYMAIAHRLGWPIHAVVSRDHMWARWDDGIPPHKGGQRFNLEATNAESSGAEGSFASLTDEQYAKWLETPQAFIDRGSDMTSLSPRQLLGVFLQSRAGYWRARGDRVHQESDLALAVKCFPQNIDIRRCYQSLISPEPWPRWRPPRRTVHGKPPLDVERINRENLERMRPPEPSPQPTNDPAQLSLPGTDPNLHLHPSR